MAEITEAQQNAVNLFNKLFNHSDPAVRAAVRKMTKEAHPEAQLPEDQVEPLIAPLVAKNEELQKALDELTKKFTENETKTAEAKTFADMQLAVEAAATEFGLTDDGRAKMLERMKETGNYSDPRAAAALVVSQMPKAPPPRPAFLPQEMNLFGSQRAEQDERLKRLHTNPAAYEDDEIAEFYRDPDKYARETLGAG